MDFFRGVVDVVKSEFCCKPRFKSFLFSVCRSASRANEQKKIQPKMNILRPLSPHLPIYKPQLTSTFPISHRISGAFLATILFFFDLLCLKIGLICFTYENVYQFFFYSSKLILISVEITILALLAYHLYNGLRHLWTTDLLLIVLSYLVPIPGDQLGIQSARSSSFPPNHHSILR